MYATWYRNIIKHTAKFTGVAGEIEQVGVLIVTHALVHLRTTCQIKRSVSTNKTNDQINRIKLLDHDLVKEFSFVQTWSRGEKTVRFHRIVTDVNHGSRFADVRFPRVPPSSSCSNTTSGLAAVLIHAKQKSCKNLQNTRVLLELLVAIFYFERRVATRLEWQRGSSGNEPIISILSCTHSELILFYR